MNEILLSLESFVWPPIIWEDWKKDYTKLEWIEKDEEIFTNYLIHIFSNKKIIRELTHYPTLIKWKKMKEKLAKDFLFNFWPKTIYEERKRTS